MKKKMSDIMAILIVGVMLAFSFTACDLDNGNLDNGNLDSGDVDDGDIDSGDGDDGDIDDDDVDDGDIDDGDIDDGDIDDGDVDALDVGTLDEWNSAVESIRTGTDSNIRINVTANIAGVAGTAPPLTDAYEGYTFGTGNITVTITGNFELALDTEQSGNLLQIGPGQTVVIKDTDLKGHFQNDVSLVFVRGSLSMQGSASVSGNSADRFGGGVYVDSTGSLSMSGDAGVYGNKIPLKTISDKFSRGGGIYSKGTLTMSGNAAVYGNTLEQTDPMIGRRGSGVCLDGGTFTMNGGKISGNTVAFQTEGIGLSVLNANFIMNGGTITGNYGAYLASSTAYACRGGGVYLSGGTITMTGGTISTNRYSDNTTYTLIEYGGGVYVGTGTFLMSGGTISGHRTNNQGAGVYISQNGTFRKTGGIIYGSPVYNGPDIPAELRNTAVNVNGMMPGFAAAYILPPPHNLSLIRANTLGENDDIDTDNWSLWDNG